MNEWSFLFLFLMWEELRRILVKTIISLCSHSLFKMFSQLVQSSCSCSTKHMWLWTQTVALMVHDLVCPGPPLPHLWNEARTALQLWLLSDLAHLAAVCICSVRVFCSLRGFFFFVIQWDRLDLSLVGLMWTSSYICPYVLMTYFNQRPSTTLGAAVSPPRNINSWGGGASISFSRRLCSQPV